MFYFIGIHELKVKVASLLQEKLSKNPLFENSSIAYNHHPRDLEREKTSILITGSAADFQRLSPDNFLSMEESRVSLAQVGIEPGQFIRWVKENCEEDLPEGVEPVDPGIFYIRVEENFPDQREFTVSVKILRRVDDEEILYNYMGEREVVLDTAPMRGCSLALRANRRKLVEGTHFTIDEDTGVITFIDGEEPALGSRLVASYTYIDETVTYGPQTVKYNHAVLDLLPGVIIAFGDCVQVGDTMVVVVTECPEISSAVFGGRTSISLQFQAKSLDTPSAERVADLLAVQLHGPVKRQLELEDIITTEVDISGESQEPEDEIEGEPAFLFNLNATYSTEWQNRVPVMKQLIDGAIINFPKDVDPYTATEEEIVDAVLEAFLSTEIGPVVEFPDPTDGKC